MNTLSKRTNS